MSTAELTEMGFEPMPNLHISISVRQFVSRPTPLLVCQEVTLASDSTISMNLLPKISTRGTPVRLDSEGGLRQLGLARDIAVDPGFPEDSRKPADTTEVTPERYHSSPDVRAIRLASCGRILGFERLEAIEMGTQGADIGCMTPQCAW
jgi:hypothetical protein